MQRLWPAPSVHLARVDEDVIVLALVQDRYDCLVNAANALVFEDTGAIEIDDPAVAQELCEAGVIMRDAPLRTVMPIIPPSRELSLDPRPPCGDVVRSAVVMSAATLKFRGRTLDELVRYHHPLRRPSPTNEERLQQIVGAARVARPWIPFEGECLQRSFLLRSVLAAQGVAADWVFGVRTFPFAAHCWLQIGDLIVGDRLERAKRFVPILRA